MVDNVRVQERIDKENFITSNPSQFGSNLETTTDVTLLGDSY
jgi:hypothetical protein